MCKLKNWTELNQEMNLPIEISKGTRCTEQKLKTTPRTRINGRN